MEISASDSFHKIAKVNHSLPEIIPDLCSARKMLFAPDILFRKGQALGREAFSFNLGHESWTILVGKQAQKFVFDLPAHVADPFVFRTKIPAMHLPDVAGPANQHLEAAFDLNRELISKRLKQVGSDNLIDILIETMEGVINSELSSERGRISDLPRFLLEASVQLASRTLLGNRVCDQLPAEWAQIYADVDSGLSIFSLFMPWIPSRKKAVAELAKARLVDILLPVIARKQTTNLAEEDLVDGFLHHHKTTGAKLALSDQNILWLINVLHWGAHHYPAVHAFWAGVDIMTRTDVFKTVLSELDDVGEITSKTIKELRVLRGCLKESVRLHSLLALPRRLLEDVCYKGNVIKKGGVISVSPYLAHRDPEMFSDGEEFCPMRWNNETTRIAPWAFIPGGGGSRGCIGMPLTLNMLTVIWATLFKRFDLEFENQPPQMVMQAMLLAPNAKVPVRYVLRGRWGD